MDFLIIFAVSGLVAIPLIMIVVSFEDGIAEKVISAVLCFILWILISLAMFYQYVSNTEKWNGGFCECGTHWELRGASKNRMGGGTKYYSCPKCYKEIEIKF